MEIARRNYARLKDGEEPIWEDFDFTDDIADKWSAEMYEFEQIGPDQLVGIGRLWFRFRTTGIEEETPMVHLLTFKGGKLSRVDTFASREQALESAGLSE